VRLAQRVRFVCGLIGVTTIAVSGNANAQTARTTTAAAATGQPDTSKEVFKALYSGDPDHALQLAQEYVKRHPRDARMLVLAARAHLARHEYTAAYDLLEGVLAIEPRNADALYFLGIASSELATQAFERVYALAPDSARVHQLMGRSLKLQGNPVEAAAEYEVALRADPNLLDALLEYAKLRREESNCAEAQALYERAQRVTPTFDGAYGLGVCLATQGDHAQAVESFRAALSYDSRSAAAEFGLGNALLHLGDTGGAVTALERAAELAPTIRETYYMLGRAYQKLGQAAKAQHAFDRATALAKADRSGDAPAKIPR
jgi:tetratricopeptide (TPR) repeat protein